MGYITNQWVNRGAWRTRTHRPIKVKVSTQPTTWNGNAVSIKATKESSMAYQEIDMTATEAEEAASVILAACGDTKQRELILDYLKGLSDARLLEVLSLALNRRKTKRKLKLRQAS
jgi:hypothetical protein